MGTLTTFGEAIMVAFITLTLAAIGFIVRSQLELNKIFSEGIQVAMSEIKILRMMAEQKEESRTISCSYHAAQITELKKKTEKIEDELIVIDERITNHIIKDNHFKNE